VVSGAFVRECAKPYDHVNCKELFCYVPYFPAQEDPAQQGTRLPCPYVYQERPPRVGRPSPSWPQGAERLRLPGKPIANRMARPHNPSFRVKWVRAFYGTWESTSPRNRISPLVLRINGSSGGRDQCLAAVPGFPGMRPRQMVRRWGICIAEAASSGQEPSVRLCLSPWG